ncbi:TonB-dependent receptor [Mucilaginibacter gynuensis]|uniref:TonB-dependent receptor n=1 Tax=Mucilaginibacter gynuensis TaxID=1302236 RepID=A0ABP8HM07_9SPHI
MNKKITLTIGCLFLYVSLFAQTLVSIKGKITDTKGAAIPAASIFFLNTNYGTSANKNGEFTIGSIPAGKYTIRVSALDYATLNQMVTIADGQGDLQLQLSPADRQLDAVTVTAQKQEEDPQKLPLSISTISAKKVQDYKLWNIRDITAIVPNLNSANPGDNRNVTGIRGIATTSYDPAVATYIDGVNQFSLDTYIAQLQDIERIEVLRGPQGTLYGRNAMGGVINIITKQPTNDTHGFAGIDYGNYNQQRYNLGLRTPLIKDKLFLGVAGLFTRQNGFYHNDFNNSRFDDQHSFTGNYYLKYLANSKLSLTLNVKHAANRNNGTFPLAISPADALATPFVLNQNTTTQLVDNTFNSSLSVNYSGTQFNFTSQSAYQSNYRYYKTPIDGDFSPIDGISVVNNYGSNWNKVQVGTQEFRFSSPASSTSAFKWIAGTYGFYQYNPVKQGTYFGQDAAYIDPNAVPNSTLLNINTLKSYGVALFGQGTYSITEKLDATIGLRYDYEHKKQFINGQFIIGNDEPMIIRSDTSSKAHFTALSPKASLQYHVNTTSGIYGSYNRGFRAGGISQLASDPSQGALYAYKPEFSNNFEIGSKNTFLNNRLRFNVALFYIRVADAQVPTLITPELLTVTRNAGKLRSKGVEAELAFAPLKGLEAEYNFGYTDAKYTNLVVGGNGTEVNLSGNRQVYTPRITSMLALQYGYEIGGSQNIKLVARGEWRYLGSQYYDLANQIEQKGFSVFNTRAGISSKRLDVFFWESNIGNKRYIDYAYDFGASHLGTPRIYGVSVAGKF